MESNEIMLKQILEIVKNQLKSNTPPETKITYDRLRKEGFNDVETKRMIGKCVSVEIFEILKSGKPYNDAHYIKNLKRLREERFE